MAADDKTPDSDRLADRPDAVTLGMDEDDQVLDQSIEPVGLGADVLGEGQAAVRLEIALRQQLCAAVDRGHGRAQLMRQDVEESLAISLLDQLLARGIDPALKPWAAWAFCWGAVNPGRRISRHHGSMVVVAWVTHRHRRPPGHYAGVAQT